MKTKGTQASSPFTIQRVQYKITTMTIPAALYFFHTPIPPLLHTLNPISCYDYDAQYSIVLLSRVRNEFGCIITLVKMEGDLRKEEIRAHVTSIRERAYRAPSFHQFQLPLSPHLNQPITPHQFLSHYQSCKNQEMHARDGKVQRFQQPGFPDTKFFHGFFRTHEIRRNV